MHECFSDRASTRDMKFSQTLSETTLLASEDNNQLLTQSMKTLLNNRSDFNNTHSRPSKIIFSEEMRTYLSQQKQRDNKSFPLLFIFLFCSTTIVLLQEEQIRTIIKFLPSSLEHYVIPAWNTNTFKHGLKCMVIYQSDVFLKQRYKLAVLTSVTFLCIYCSFLCFAGKGAGGNGTSESRKLFPLQTNTF
ncbi:hypothetical protein CEXT_499281 [Caerostris extrusa]|uniref:Uncharacterized protein n=1 Tax=Caerostris extrusa TaxID=172846 RepID=A0AAV4NSQ9_CAEEX|nr:hypothetical protein CEXT_499281 [Caerostris extrusa]